MSLMSTLAKVAIGVAVAKGAGAMMNKGSGASQALAGGGLGGLLGSLRGAGGVSAGGAGGLQGMLGGLMGGSGGASGGTGGLGGLLESLGGAQSGGQGGGLQSMLGGLAGAGGLMGALAGAMGGAAKPAATPSNASFGHVLNSAFDANPEPAIEPTADQEAAAGLMLRAMIQAAKSDGNFDDAEREKLIGQLGDEIDSDEAAFVQAEMKAPVDVDGLVGQVPRGMEPQVYAMSVIAINLDSQAEAKYLHQLAQGLGLSVETINDVHAQLGVPSLYA
ncbi:MAG: uncharacterized membrane protein YebE (DUF533 family) [Candidatus Azotimanducaceae bacterium]|jgi:uncharacterized membrane protein YebE (DUF533 family)